MRVATIHIIAMSMVLAACQNVGDFVGLWAGSRVGTEQPLAVGIPTASVASFEITAITTHGLTGKLSVPSLVESVTTSSLAGAEADALSGMTFTGSPIHVYLLFAPTSDGGGDVLAMIALYEDRRIELRLLRGGSVPIYAIYALTES